MSYFIIMKHIKDFLEEFNYRLEELIEMEKERTFNHSVLIGWVIALKEGNTECPCVLFSYHNGNCPFDHDACEYCRVCEICLESDCIYSHPSECGLYCGDCVPEDQHICSLCDRSDLWSFFRRPYRFRRVGEFRMSFDLLRWFLGNMVANEIIKEFLPFSIDKP